MNAKKSKVSFWKKLMINSAINNVLSDNDEAQAYGAAALIKEGSKVLPALEREQTKITSKYHQLREEQRRPIGETAIRGESDIPYENQMLLRQSVLLGDVEDEIKKNSKST